MWRYSSHRRIPVPSKNINVKLVTSLDIVPAFVSRKNKLAPNLGDPKHTSYKQAQDMQKKVPEVTTQKKRVQRKIHSACKSKSSAPRKINRKFQDHYI